MRAFTISNKQNSIPLSVIHPRDLVCEYQFYGIGWFIDFVSRDIRFANTNDQMALYSKGSSGCSFHLG